MHATPSSYRADLQSLNELNFARFDARLEQRIVGVNARIDRVTAELQGRIGRLETELNARIEKLGIELNAKIDRTAAELKAELIKWMFVFWAGSALAAWLAR